MRLACTVLLSLAAVNAQAQMGDKAWETQTPLPSHLKPPPSPALPPTEALATFRTAEGFAIDLVASEPLVQDPVAMEFDEDGRIWAVEMRGFMPDLHGNGEAEPVGRISILTDTDQDGACDEATVFLDRLVLPRAIRLTRGGALVATATQLLFARDLDQDDVADRITIIDPDYITSGSVEHSANGLLLAIDNWIYSANSETRYRFLDGRWTRQRTESRGQWGISQDDYGRLFYNYNYSQLHADLTPPNYITRNPHHPTEWGINLMIATNQQVFPIRMNTGVNRGYRPGLLDDQGRLLAFASACAPMVYRGDQYPAEFRGNVFVCGPGANIVKRNLVFLDGLTLTSRQATPGSEFLASTDERFRPVNLCNGPDGNLYVVDMYRGILQHRLYMTTHLRNEIRSRNLSEPIHLGRIYRVRPAGSEPRRSPALSEASVPELIGFLTHPNAWHRDTAQRLLVERGDPRALPQLIDLALHGPNSPARIHALWTLEGLRPENPEPLLPATRDPDPQVQLAAVRVIETLAAGSPRMQRRLLKQFQHLTPTAPPLLLFQITLSAGSFQIPDAVDFLVAILDRHPDQLHLRHAVLSGLDGRELQALGKLLDLEAWRSESAGRGQTLQDLASAIIKERDPGRVSALLDIAARQTALLAWRQNALLDGVAGNLEDRRFAPVPLPRKPALIDTMTQADPNAGTLTNLMALFSWPGHSGRAAVATRKRSATAAYRDPAYAQGQEHFRNACAVCHGVNGRGITPLAPPLLDSEWVLGPEERLTRIVLHGLEGPIRVNGASYAPPIVLPEMPSMAALDDPAIAAILTYLRNAWGHEATSVTPESVAAIRRQTALRDRPWTEPELLQLPATTD